MVNTDNMVILSGRLTRDAETILDGKQVKFSIAIDNSGYEKATDSTTGFFDCVAWLTPSEYSTAADVKDINNLIEQNLLTKGALVRVFGSMKQNRYVDKNDNKRNDNHVVVDKLTAYVARNKQDSDAPQTNTATATTSYDEPF